MENQSEHYPTQKLQHSYQSPCYSMSVSSFSEGFSESLVQALYDGMRQGLKQTGEQISKLDHKLETVSEKVANVDYKIDDIGERVRRLESAGRKHFSQRTRNLLTRILWSNFGGCCPVSGIMLMNAPYSLVKDDAKRSVAVFEHWNGNHNNRITNGWIVHRDVNIHFERDPEYKQQCLHHFYAFQIHVKQMLEKESGKQLEFFSA